MKQINRFRDSLSKYRKLDSEIHKLRKKCNLELDENNQIASIIYDTNGETFAIKKSDIENQKTIHKIYKEHMTQGRIDEELNSNQSPLNLYSDKISKNTLNRIFSSFNEIIKDEDGKIYGTRLQSIYNVGHNGPSQQCEIQTLNRVKDKSFDYELIDKSSNTPDKNPKIKKFYYIDPFLHNKLINSGIKISQIVGENELLVHDKNILNLYPHVI